MSDLQSWRAVFLKAGDLLSEHREKRGRDLQAPLFALELFCISMMDAIDEVTLWEVPDAD